MKQILLTQGKVALVDDCDFEELNKYKWCAVKGNATFYALRGVTVDGKHTTIKMHRQILNLVKGDGIMVDHRDHCGTNNQRENLRCCTNAQNIRNMKTHRFPKSSKLKGVYWNKRDKTWQAKICLNQKQIHLGRFTSEEDAARAYDLAAIELHGEFASINFPALPS